jgi:hypothetical protein
MIALIGFCAAAGYFPYARIPVASATGARNLNRFASNLSKDD